MIVQIYAANYKLRSLKSSKKFLFCSEDCVYLALMPKYLLLAYSESIHKKTAIQKI